MAIEKNMYPPVAKHGTGKSIIHRLFSHSNHIKTKMFNCPACLPEGKWYPMIIRLPGQESRGRLQALSKNLQALDSAIGAVQGSSLSRPPSFSFGGFHKWGNPKMDDL
jgi:hypothetical protein